MQNNLHQPTVIAYPIISPNAKSDMEDNVYSSNIGESNYADDTIEMSGNFFSQLDSMIAAVKVESSALDSMKEKLKEVDALRNQISTFTKRLLDADQANLNLKTNLVKVQEAYTELKKSKAETESAMVPLRQELNRTKEAYSKERMARLSAQQETAMLKDQIMRLEKINENIDRECKTIPALVESNEILKTDLANLRKRSKEEKAALLKQIKQMETQARDVEAIKADVRGLAMRLLDISAGGSNNPAANSGGASSSNYSSNMNNLNILQQRQANEQQMYHHGNSSAMLLTTSSAAASNVQYEYGFEGGEEEYDEYGGDEDGGTVSRGDDSVYDGHSFVDEGHGLNGGGSIDSINSQIRISPPRNSHKGGTNNIQQQQQMQQQAAAGSGSRAVAKKKVKRIVQQGGGAVRGVNMMQQIPNNEYSGVGGNSGQQQQQMYRGGNPNSGGHDGMMQSFSLPRIHG